MKASDLIKKLSQLIAQHGDLEVFTQGDDEGFQKAEDAYLGTPIKRMPEPYIMIS